MSSSDVVRGSTRTVDAPVIDEPNIVAPPPAEWLPVPAPQRRARRHPLRHWTVRLVLAPLLVGALLWPLLIAGGVDSAQAGRLALVVGIQVFGGALVWRLARGSHAPYLVEQIGMGLAIGTLLTLLAQQLLRVTPLAEQAWWLPAAAVLLLAVVLVALPVTRRRLRLGEDAALGLDELGGVGAGLAAGALFIWNFWRGLPLGGSGWRAYEVDIPYHEALANSVTTWGPGDNVLAVGSSVRYHWFVHAFAGTTTNAAGAGPFVVITRVLPVLSLLATVCLVWAWARRLSDHRAVPVLAVVITTVAANVATLFAVDYMHELVYSPSMAFGAVWLLGASLAFTEHVNRRLRWGLVMLGLLTVGAVGGKSSNLVALFSGAGLAAVACVWLPDIRRRVWSAFAVVLALGLAAFVVVLLGSDGNLTFHPGASALRLGMLPGQGRTAVLVGSLATVLVLGTKWTGLLALLPERRTLRRPELWFGVGAAISGLLLAVALGHPGASQFYFPLSSGMIASVISAWGLGEALRRMSGAALGAAIAVGVVAGGASVAFAHSIAVHGADRSIATLPPRYAWLAPVLVWMLPVALFVGAALRVRMRASGSRRAGLVGSARRVGLVGVLCWGLVTATVVTGQFTMVDLARTAAPAAPQPTSDLAWSGDQSAPLLWLREHSSINDVLATNRQCSSPQLPGQTCRVNERWFLTAALTDRRMYVEGADYANTQPPPAWIDQRVELSRRFVDTPNVADARVLWAAGVRWVVVDLASTYTRSWVGYGDPVYRTPTTIVLRLLKP
ncbi:MAG: hypothetical protein ACXVGD_16315 [Blastococcus sp.]